VSDTTGLTAISTHRTRGCASFPLSHRSIVDIADDRSTLLRKCNTSEHLRVTVAANIGSIL